MTEAVKAIEHTTTNKASRRSALSAHDRRGNGSNAGEKHSPAAALQELRCDKGFPKVILRMR